MDKHNENDKFILGFWIYLMTDLVMFAVLFAAFAVLRGNTFGGAGARELFSLPFALVQTLILLSSSFTCGMTMLAVNKKNKQEAITWLTLTLLLGLTFVTLEFTEFSHLIAEGNNWQRSAFLSSYFTLLGTHGLHILVGLLWIVVAMAQIWHKGLNDSISSKLMRFSLFWHFLDLVWIFIFTIVYLLGSVK
jgi:cytochrome o ubiquinol oxidase subunit 3